MKLISHRGNLNQKNTDFENLPERIDEVLNKKIDCEIDVRFQKGEFFLGHDSPQHKVNLEWFIERKKSIWIHCKDVDSMIYFKRSEENFNFFWHENDKLTLTSHGFIWVYPGNQPIQSSIAVLPELFDDDISSCLGICSDTIVRYAKELKYNLKIERP